jgi:hypothetical protein
MDLASFHEKTNVSMAIYFFLRYHVQLPENILNVCFFQFYPDVDEHLPDRVLARLIII